MKEELMKYLLISTTICYFSFIWGTLLEFTVVIFLKYYLRHLPTFQFSRENSRAVSMAQRKQPVFDVKTHVNAWLKVI